ncbi:hypothetical protein MPSEU_000291200 [Mayamaea pseudoterrestris]|nr:hypothetical protein MPSEU_000291200 [Mayamaea pseudoterrestris]
MTNHSTNASSGGLSPRFTTWVAFFIFSIIVLGSSIEIKKSQSDPTPAAKWSVTCSILTVCMSTLVLASHFVAMLSSVLVGTKVEGVVIGILVVLWASIVSIVTDTNNHLAVISIDTTNGQTDPTAAVSLNGNLYYFSWAGFVTSILLIVSYLREAFGVDVVGSVRNRAARLEVWAGLLASAMVVMGSSVRVYKDQLCGSDETLFCERTTFAVAVGSLGVILSLGTVGMKLLTTTAPFAIEFGISTFLCILNTFGVSYITSPTGPGSNIGNLYYFSWISFMCGAMLMADCFNQYSEGSALRAVQESERNDDLNLKGDIPIEETDTYDEEA